MRARRVIAVAASGVVVVGVIASLVVLASRPRADPAPAPTAAAPAEAPAATAAGESAEPSADAAWLERVAAETGIPDRALAAYVHADIVTRADSGCAVGWNTLAGIGWVESHHGTLQGGAVESDGVARPSIVGIPLDGTNDTMEIADTDGGALDGDARWDRAVGPMQFIPETWSIWGVDADGDGVVDPHDVDDAALTAARYLCRAHGTLDGDAAWIGAVRTYNDTRDYQLRVAEAATRYAAAG